VLSDWLHSFCVSFNLRSNTARFPALGPVGDDPQARHLEESQLVYLSFPRRIMRAMTSIPFTVNISDTALPDLELRLGLTRSPDGIRGSGWEYGVPLAVLQKTVKHWRETSTDARQKGNSIGRRNLRLNILLRRTAQSAHAQ
jgi:hypothetical protein